MLSGLYNRTLERIILPVGDRIEGGSFVRWLRRYREEQWLPAAELQKLQELRLGKVLAHAQKNVPFFHQVKLSGDPFESIKNFPIVTKSDINAYRKELIVGSERSLVSESGSGSSGIQSTVFMDRSAQASQRAMQALWFEWCGYRMGESILQTGITPNRRVIKRAKDIFLNTEYVPAFDLTPDSIRGILTSLNDRPRQYLFGYASSLYVLASSALEYGISGCRFKYAVSWGDKLFPHYRQKIRQAFGCETLDTYGCTEGAMIGAECPSGAFHLSVNQCYLEIVDDDGMPVPSGEMGKVIVTRLDNFAMPLIRYYLGDLAELETDAPERCECGRSLPLLRRIIGRDTDIVRTRSGKHMIVHFFTGIFEHIPEVRQFKVVQEDLDAITIQYIPGPNFEPVILSRIEAAINGHLKEQLPVTWVRTETIEATKSGKPQIIQSFLKQSLSH